MRHSLVMTAALAATAFGANAQNLMLNGSFETPGPGFITFADWQFFNNVFADDNVEQTAPDGVRSAKMFGFGNGMQNDHGLFQTVGGINEGMQYTLSSQVLNPSIDAIGAENIILLQMNFQDAGGATLESVEVDAIDIDNDPFDTWVTKTVSGIAPAGTTQITVYLLHIQLGADAGFPTQEGGASFWDNITLVEGGDVPCTNPADINGDGVIDFFDISGFLQLYAEGCP